MWPENSLYNHCTTIPYLRQIQIQIQQEGQWTAHQVWQKGHSNQSCPAFQRALRAQSRRSVSSHLPGPPLLQNKGQDVLCGNEATHSKCSWKHFTKETKKLEKIRILERHWKEIVAFRNTLLMQREQFCRQWKVWKSQGATRSGLQILQYANQIVGPPERPALPHHYHP